MQHCVYFQIRLRRTRESGRDDRFQPPNSCRVPTIRTSLPLCMWQADNTLTASRPTKGRPRNFITRMQRKTLVNSNCPIIVSAPLTQVASSAEISQPTDRPSPSSSLLPRLSFPAACPNRARHIADIGFSLVMQLLSVSSSSARLTDCRSSLTPPLPTRANLQWPAFDSACTCYLPRMNLATLPLLGRQSCSLVLNQMSVLHVHYSKQLCLSSFTLPKVRRHNYTTYRMRRLHATLGQPAQPPNATPRLGHSTYGIKTHGSPAPPASLVSILACLITGRGRGVWISLCDIPIVTYLLCLRPAAYPRPGPWFCDIQVHTAGVDNPSIILRHLGQQI